MSENRKLLNSIIILLFFASAISIRMHLDEFSEELTKYTEPFMSPRLIFIGFIFFLGLLIVKNWDKIRDIDNLDTKDMIYVALLLIGFATMIFLTIYGLIIGSIY